MVRNIVLYKKAVSLRKLGNSYSQISKLLKLPKSTLSTWFSNKKWSKLIGLEINKKWKKRNSIHIRELSRINKQKKIDRFELYSKEAKQVFPKIKNNPLFIAGLCIYWGEGEKTGSGRVSVINTDAYMIKLTVKFYKEILHTPTEKLRGAIFIYKDINPQKSLDFWSSVTRIPKSQFIKTQVLPSKTNRQKKGKIKNGICSVYFSSVEASVKIGEWIRLLSSAMRV